MSEFFDLNKSDFVKGMITTVFASILTVVYTVVNQPDFDVFVINWHYVIGNVLNVGTITMVSYLMKNLLTNAEGQFFKKERD